MAGPNYNRIKLAERIMEALYQTFTGLASGNGEDNLSAELIHSSHGLSRLLP